MKMNFIKKHLSFILCMMLTAALMLCAAGCNGSTEKNSSDASVSGQDGSSSSGADDKDSSAAAPEDEDPAAPSAKKDADSPADGGSVGEGSTQFDFTVTDQDGAETQFVVHTDKTIVGEALQELGLIDGDESEYGLYVKTVNGITADYDTDGVYWAFYVNGEYSQEGVDSTEIKEGDSYAFKVEKG